MYKERANLYGLYPKTWKGMLLCQQQKLKPTELLILSRQSEMSQNPPLFGDVLSAEEPVLGCMCDSFRL
ncbi:hypothetical protein HN51_036301 [Arachis hypogaea]